MKHCSLILLLALIASLGCTAQPDNTAWQTLSGKAPIVIAHRGDSGSYPEHTLAGYQSAMDKGADFIEPDIVMTKDGVPICRHDLELGKTTDAAKHVAFTDRKTKGWLAAEFTLKEVKQLRALQHMKGRDRSMDGLYRVPTLSELIDLIHEHNKANRTDVGLLIEIKAPDKQRAQGLDVSMASYKVVKAKAAAGKKVPVIFQCFDRDACERIARWGGYRVDWLTSKEFSFDDLPKGIGGLGLNKELIQIKGGKSPEINTAHAMGLCVNAWTYRNDRLPDGIDPKHPEHEMLAYLQAGLDGVITDFPATGVLAKQLLLEQEYAGPGVEPLSNRIRDNSPRRLIKRY